jgi:hypothetical protein
MTLSQTANPREQAHAEQLGLEALVFIAGREDDMGRFMAEAGCDPTEIRERAADAEFLAGVLDFLLADERLLIAFAAELNLDPTAPARARRHLPGWSPL